MLTCYRYIELNPVRADMDKYLWDYPWSSYGANVLGKTDPLVTPHELYRAPGNRRHQRQAAYQGLFQTQIDTQPLDDIHLATQKDW